MEFSNLKSNIYNKKHVKNKTKIFYIKKKTNKSYEYKIHQIFIKKYSSMPLNYNLFIANNIIFNDKTHLVSKFKEYLVINDEGEFLKRYYKKNESIEKLPKFFEFYFLFSKLFPNYTSINENKFLYNNIHQKQRMIDIQEEMEKEKKIEKKELKIKLGNDNNYDVFSTDIINSLLNSTNKEGVEILFDVKSDKLTEEENNFNDGVNHIIDKIDNYKNEINNNKNKQDNIVIHNSINLKEIKNNLNKNKILKNLQSNNNKENISILSNTNINKINNNILLRLTKNACKIKNKNKDKNTINEIKKHILNIRKNNLRKNLSNKIINLNDNSKNKTIYKKIKENNITEKIEENLFKIRKLFKNNRNYASQNISTSIQSKKDFSIPKKNINQLNINNNGKNSISTFFNVANIPSSRVRSTKLSSSNSFIKEIKKQKFHINKKLSGNKETMSFKNLNKEINWNLEKYSRNKQLQNSSTTSNIFNNIIKYINKKFVDSRNNKNNIKINTSSKINISSLSNRIQTSKNKNNKSNKILFNNSKKIYNYETQNNREFTIKNKVKKILYHNKSINNLNLENSIKLFNNSLINKKQKTFKNIKLSNQSSSNNSSKNLFINSYKKIGIHKNEKKSIESYNFCDTGRNLGRNGINKRKLVINNKTYIKFNFSIRTKNNSKENSFKNNVITSNNSKKNIKTKIQENKNNIFMRNSML